MSKKNYNLFLTIIVFWGIFLRWKQFFFNRPLWLDESFIALNLIEKNLSDLLFHKLDYCQKAPFGFLFIEKLFVNSWGDTEYALRLFPFIAGLLSILIFSILVREVLNKGESLIAIYLFSTCSSLIYYSSEVKPFSSDILIALTLILFFLKSNSFKSKASILIVGLVSLVSALTSYTGILIVFACTSLVLIKRSKDLFIKTSPILIGSAIGFLVSYKLQFKTVIHNPHLYKFWEWFFITIPLDEKSYELLNKFFIDLNGKGATLGLIFFCFGAIIAFVKKEQKVYYFGFPIILIFILSTLGKYPFYERFLVILHPLAIILTVKGISVALSLKRFNALIKLTIVAYVVMFSIQPIKNLFFPCVRHDIRTVLRHIQKNYKDGDVIYIELFSQYPYKYYAKRYGFNPNLPIPKSQTLYKEDGTLIDKEYWSEDKKYFLSKLQYPGPEEFSNRHTEIWKIKGHKRVWVLHSHRPQFLIKNKLVMNEYGKEIYSYYSYGRGYYGDKNPDYALTILYDFSNEEPLL